MSNKRAYSAYLASTPATMPRAANGLDPLQLQAQQSTPFSNFHLQIPGAWPQPFPAFEEEVAPEPAPTSIFTTLGRWAATVSVTNLLSLPGRLANRFLRQQTIKTIPLISSTGSNKRRFVAAGLAEEEVATPSPSVRARAQKARRQVQYETRASHFSLPTLRHDDGPWQILEPTHAPGPFTSHLLDTEANPDLETSPNPVYNPRNDPNEEGDVSIDFSFDDILTSTPPRNSRTGSPVHVSWHSPHAHSPTGHVSSLQPQQIAQNPAPSCDLSRFQSSVSRTQGSVSPSTKEPTAPANNPRRAGRRAIRLPSMTPMRRQLVKLQFGAEYRRLQATRQAEPQMEPTDQGSAETESLKITPTEAVNQDLSYLSDASSPSQVEVHSKVDPASNNTHDDPDIPEFEYDNDLSFLLDAPSPPPRKGVRWAKHAGAKPFYYDEKVSDMLDSTLEIINSSPVRGFWHNFQSDEQATSNIGNINFSPSSSAASSPNTTPRNIQVDDGGFRGVPRDTFDTSDDSLEESELSLELVADLQNDLKTKLALAPPPPPPPKPLITPLSGEELETLHAAAANTSNGRKADKWVIEQKLYARDFATLLPYLFNGDPRAWLNDNIVNEYLAILVAAKKKEAGFEHKRGGPAPPVHAFSSFCSKASSISTQISSYTPSATGDIGVCWPSIPRIVPSNTSIP
ncbi:sentrin 17 [Stemphylium lycopersici]|uniref:Sentrin 17 n=1 Tax=Stemphylium lycopersici TaxID=183478 RepID=A0A364ND51_STELY|nr:sentrin 17 [Stemphylium lycopersici]RAR10449.1 sentrin 17 [Stemphylium lycopersici]RAR15182.1 sentrin 17 [Stemphylium lycopersici]